MNKNPLWIFGATLAAATIVVLSSMRAAVPALAQPPSGEVKPHMQLVVHSQEAGSNAAGEGAPDATGMARVNSYSYFFATGSGQRQTGTNDEVREETIHSPLGIGSQLVLSSQVDDGDAHALSEVASVIRGSDRGLSVIGTLVARSSGAGAAASAKWMLGLVLNGPSTVRIDNCALFNQAVLSGQTGLSRERGSCFLQASGDAAKSMDLQGIPVPAKARDGQFIVFEIDLEQGDVAGKGSEVNTGFAIEILPGAGECVLVVEGAGSSPLEDLVVPLIPDAVPNILIHTRTDRVLEDIQGDIDLGLSPNAGEDAHAVARAAADRLVQPVDADLTLEFDGPAVSEGVHKVTIRPRTGDPVTVGFDYHQSQGPEDLEAFKRLMIEALQGLAEKC